MFENTSNKYNLENLINVEHNSWANFKFWVLDYSQIDDFNFSLLDGFTNVLILEGKIENLKNTEKLRALIPRTVFFTKYDLLKKFGFPEKTYYFNVVIEYNDFFISNFSPRINEETYDQDKNYDRIFLNTIKIINITQNFSEIIDQDKFFNDVVKFICCGCSVIFTDLELLNLFEDRELKYLNKILSADEALLAEIHFHERFGTSHNVLYVQKIINSLFY